MRVFDRGGTRMHTESVAGGGLGYGIDQKKLFFKRAQFWHVIRVEVISIHY
jgi:hypothetical protein